MKVLTTMRYREVAIADVTWELNDKAKDVNKALAALSVEDYLKEDLSFEHKVLNDNEYETKEEINTETGSSQDSSVSSNGNSRHHRVEHPSEID